MAKHFEELKVCKSIVHIIHRDKFTFGYIKFMEDNFPEYSHVFITFLNKLQLSDEFEKDNSIILLQNSKCLLKSKKIKNILDTSDKIILSGLFTDVNEFSKMDKKILQKSYLQFWGGDFYKYKDLNVTGFHTFKRKFYDKKRLAYIIKNCAGIINLIPEDWYEFYKIFPYKVKHFMAPMPDDPKKKIDYSKLYNKNKKNNNHYRILIGNSATKTNQHIDTFEKIKAFVDKDIELIVPLSYGDSGDYKDLVIKKGYELFGNKFTPVLNYMDKTEYAKLLNTCDIGIFNNNRQQAMGNINMMLSLGKKIYLRNDTSMWIYYKNHDIIIFDVDKIQNMTFEDFIYMDENDRSSNIKNIEYMSTVENEVKSWRVVLEDKV